MRHAELLCGSAYREDASAEVSCGNEERTRISKCAPLSGGNVVFCDRTVCARWRSCVVDDLEDGA